MNKFVVLYMMICLGLLAACKPVDSQNKSETIRIGIASFKMETCTFCPRKTGIKEFEHYGLPFTGDDVLNHTGDGTVGFVNAVREYGNVEVVGIYAVRDPLGGSMGSWVTKAAFDKYSAAILEHLASAGKLDAIYLPLHGGMAAEGIARPEAELARRIKEKFPNTPIAITMDLHGNEDAELMQHADILLTVKRFPHYDFNLMGERAARLLIRTVRETYQPVMAVRRPNIAFATVYGGTHQGAPRDIMERARRWENRSIDTYVSVFMGFPFADVVDVGMSVFVMTNGDQVLADKIANDMNAYIKSRKHNFEYDIPKLSEGMSQGYAFLENGHHPIVLANMSDRLGDATHIMDQLIKHNAENFVIATVRDKKAIEYILTNHKLGDKVSIELGGHTSNLAGPRQTISGTVDFIGKFNIGGAIKSDLISIKFGANNYVLLTPTRYQVTTRKILDYAQIPVDSMDIFVVKSRNHFRRGFMETGLAKKAVVIDAPGHGPADIGQLDFKNMPKNTFSRFLEQ